MTTDVIAPGATIGILGGGQLGRMLSMAAAQLGYRVHIYAPPGEEGDGTPAADVSAASTEAAWDDWGALGAFARAVDVVTFEFENVPVETVRYLAERVPVRPGVRALEVAQDRLAEKAFARAEGGRVAPHRAVDDVAELRAALAEIGAPAILKTRRFGYDGKGQARIDAVDGAEAAWEAIGGQPAILEARVAFAAEFSILIARGADGACAVYDAPRNEHRGGILHRSTAPGGPMVASQAEEAAGLARRIAESLDYVGLLAVEFFACAEGPVFNEMAPRVHNSGHWSIEGAATSQFENHVRAVCGLPLGAVTTRSDRAEMVNLIGDEVEGWGELLAEPGAHLHLYGKHVARPGRKMGHVTRESLSDFRPEASGRSAERGEVHEVYGAMGVSQTYLLTSVTK